MPVTRILWRPNTRGEGLVGNMKTDEGMLIVFPSAVGQNSPPNAGCKTRLTEADLPKPGDLESCIVFCRMGDTTGIAYPTGTPSQRLPGVSEPHMIVWEENAREPGKVISGFLLEYEGQTEYFRIFPGDNDLMDGSIHHKDLSEPWDNYPNPGDKTSCWINWFITKSGTLVGYAYSAKSEEEEEEDPGVPIVKLPSGFLIGDTEVIVIPLKPASIEAWYDEDGDIRIAIIRD